MTGKVILHIGTPKTATSALQMFFVMNREEFKKQGIFYPAFDKRSRKIIDSKNPTIGYKGNGTVVRNAFARDYNDFTINNKIRFRQITQAVKKYPYVLLSAEDFFDMGNEAFYRNFTSRGIEVEVICYLRRQDRYIESFWSFFLKAYNDFNYECIDFYRSKEIQEHYCFDYYKRICEISQWVGAKHVHVRSFEHLEGDIYHDFFSAFGLAFHDSYKIPKGMVNEKLALEMQEVKRRINEYGFTNKNAIGTAIKAVQDSENLTFKGSFLTPDEQTEICERYRKHNDQLAEEFMNGQLLFTYETDDRTFTIDEDTIDKLLCQTLAKLAHLQQDEIHNTKKLHGISLFMDKVKRTLHKYAVLMHLTDEGYGNTFQRQIAYLNKPDASKTTECILTKSTDE